MLSVMWPFGCLVTVTIQDGFGVGPYLGSAGQVARLPVVWK